MHKPNCRLENKGPLSLEEQVAQLEENIARDKERLRELKDATLAERKRSRAHGAEDYRGLYSIRRPFVSRGCYTFQVKNKKTGSVKTIRTKVEAKHGGAKSRKEAYRIVREKLDSLIDDRGIKAIRIDKALSTFISAKQDLRESYRRDLSYMLVVLKRHFKKTLVCDIKKRHVADFLKRLESEGRSRKTRLKYLKFLKGFFNDCVENDYTSKNPSTGVKNPKVERYEKKRKALELEELKMLLRVAREKSPEYIFRAALLSAHTAMRRGEILKATWSWVSLEKDQETITVPKKETKSHRTHVIPLHSELAEQLRSWKRSDNASKSDFLLGKKLSCLQKKHKELIRRTNEELNRIGSVQLADEKQQFHCLRHTAATEIRKRFGTAYSMALCNHSPKSISDVYTTVSTKALREKVCQMPRLLSEEADL